MPVYCVILPQCWAFMLSPLSSVLEEVLEGCWSMLLTSFVNMHCRFEYFIYISLLVICHGKFICLCFSWFNYVFFEFQICCDDPSLAMKVVLDRFQSVVITATTGTSDSLGRFPQILKFQPIVCRPVSSDDP